MKASLRGIAWCGFADFGLQLCLLFFLALCAEQLRHEESAVPVLDLRLPDLAGGQPAADPSTRALLVEFDGQRVAVAGETIGDCADDGVLAEVVRRVRREPSRPLQLMLPDGPYARLLAAVGAKEVRFGTDRR